MYSDAKSWNHDQEVNGLLLNKVSSEPMFIFRRYKELYADPLLDQFGFCSVKCIGESDRLYEPCVECVKSFKYFTRRSDESVNLRATSINLKINNKFIDESPGMLGDILDTVKSERKSEQKKRSHAKRMLEKLSAGDGGDDLDLENFDADMLFDEELKSLVEKSFKSGEDITDSELQKYILDECILNTKRARRS